jgi:peroxiredoxin Q/BCP
MIEPGIPAPDFELPDQHGELVRLSDFRGQIVVVYFYPKADTPGCTAQACGVRDRRADYKRAGAVVLGISRDPVARIAAFADGHDLRFPLLSDKDHAVAERYGTWVEKSMYGRAFMSVARATVVVDAEGIVAATFPKVSPKTHDEVVLAALGELRAAA